MSKRFVILGAGESGIGAAILAGRQGYDVFVSDGGPIKDNYRKDLEEHRIPFEDGGHSEEKILNAAEVMKSPGIPEKKRPRTSNSEERNPCHQRNRTCLQV